jgi:hypothetical protein
MLLAPLAFVLAICLPVGVELHADADECLTLDQAYVAAEPHSITAVSADRDAGEAASAPSAVVLSRRSPGAH